MYVRFKASDPTLQQQPQSEDSNSDPYKPLEAHRIPLRIRKAIVAQYPQWKVDYRGITFITIMYSVVLVKFERDGKRYQRFVSRKHFYSLIPKDGRYNFTAPNRPVREVEVTLDNDVLLVMDVVSHKIDMLHTRDGFVIVLGATFQPLHYEALPLLSYVSRPKQLLRNSL